MSHEHGNHAPESCKEVFALLSQYLDRELPDATCDEIREHLADCPPCIEFLASLKKTVELCRCYEAREHPTPLAGPDRQKLAEAYKAMLAARGQKGT